MLAKARQTAAALGLGHVEFREGLAEALPVEDGWADVVISNGSSTCAPTSGRCSPRPAGCCAPAGGSSSPTSPTAVPYPFEAIGGAEGEANARAFDVYGYAFMATLPAAPCRR
jgi:arsenite methyltransferase